MKNEIIIFEDADIKLGVSLKDETVWLTQLQMAELFETIRRNIGLHINNIYQDNELEITSVEKNYFYTARDGKEYRMKYYNLDMIISVGYRVKSKNGVKFRQWANKILKEYLIHGYIINQPRLDYLEKTVKVKFK